MAQPTIPNKIDPDAYYDLKLAFPVEYGGRRHSPAHRIIVKGSELDSFKNAIVTATKLPSGAEAKI